MDMVELGPERSVRKIVIKPVDTDLDLTWIIAVWTPSFTRFMHEYLVTERVKFERGLNVTRGPVEAKELFFGDVIQTAIQRDMHVSSVTFTNGKCLDIGSSKALRKAILINTPISEDF